MGQSQESLCEDNKTTIENTVNKTKVKAGSQYMQTRRSVGVVVRFYARIDLNSIPATSTVACIVNPPLFIIKYS